MIRIACRVIGHRIHHYPMSNGWTLKMCWCGRVVAGLYAPRAE